MKIWRDPAEVPAGPSGRAVTIGAFDGVHLGHQAVLRLVHDLAAARGLSSTVLTFDRHPAEVVRPGSAPKLLTDLEQKLELLEATGTVDECVVMPFDEARSKETAEDFVETLLAGTLRARLVVVGADFHFGHRRHGDVPLLQRMGAELGFEAIGLGLVAAPDSTAGSEAGAPYSSTRVRSLLGEGDVEAAARILGRPHEVRGVLERGTLVVPGRICLPAPRRYASELVTGKMSQPVLATVQEADDTDDASVRRIGVDDVTGAGAGSLRFLHRA